MGMQCLIRAAIDVKFVLLHEGKNDDGIRSFFVELWELYLKVYVARRSLTPRI